MLPVEYRRAPEPPFHDDFRDEDRAHAMKLGRAGVPVESHLHPGAPHESDSIAFDSGMARRAPADRGRVLRSA
jgi:acetyl esterase/lipase